MTASATDANSAAPRCVDLSQIFLSAGNIVVYPFSVSMAAAGV